MKYEQYIDLNSNVWCFDVGTILLFKVIQNIRFQFIHRLITRPTSPTTIKYRYDEEQRKTIPSPLYPTNGMPAGFRKYIAHNMKSRLLWSKNTTKVYLIIYNTSIILHNNI